MSTDANAALAWPIEITEFAYLGDELADELQSGAEGSEWHYGAFTWTFDSENRPMFTLLGTTHPGQFYSYSPWAEDRMSVRGDREFAGLYADAGFFMDPRNNDPHGDGTWYPPRVRPCVGDPRMDPTVLEEGAVVPWLQPAVLWDLPDLGGLLEPCQPIGCDNGHHLPGCPFTEVDEEQL